MLSGLPAMGTSTALYIQGAGLGGDDDESWGRRAEMKPGRYSFAVSIITPHCPLISDGKAPDLSGIAAAIAKAVSAAARPARRDVQPDDVTPEELQARQERAARRQQRESDEAEWRTIQGPRVLLNTIRGEAEATGISVDDLTVGSSKHDPFRMDTPGNHRIGRWLADQAKGLTLHLRGLHYLLVVTSAIRPDGLRYSNDKRGWRWLQDALNAARWLGYIPFSQIVDERNDPPVWAPAFDPALVPAIEISDPELPDVPDLADLVPGLSLAWGGAADRQAFHLCLFGEKTSLRDVLAPLAKEFRTDLLLDSGEPSNTHLDDLVTNAIKDGRSLVILTFTDCDPTGWGIPATVARKVDAMLRLVGSDLHVRVIRACLTPEQARDLDLPDSPLKETEARAERWRAEMGIDQIEIDALATVRPAVLEQIARDAIAQFYDMGLAKRAREAREAWESKARSALAAALDQMPEHAKALKLLRRHHAASGKAHEAIGATVGDLRGTMQQAIDQVDMPTLPDLPKWQAPDLPLPDALFDTADSFVANTRRLQAAKLRPDDGGADDDKVEE